MIDLSYYVKLIHYYRRKFGHKLALHCFIPSAEYPSLVQKLDLQFSCREDVNKKRYESYKFFTNYMFTLEKCNQHSISYNNDVLEYFPIGKIEDPIHFASYYKKKNAIWLVSYPSYLAYMLYKEKVDFNSIIVDVELIMITHFDENTGYFHMESKNSSSKQLVLYKPRANQVYLRYVDSAILLRSLSNKPL